MTRREIETENRQTSVQEKIFTQNDKINSQLSIICYQGTCPEAASDIRGISGYLPLTDCTIP